MMNYTVVYWYRPTVDSGIVKNEENFDIYYNAACKAMLELTKLFSFQLTKGLIVDYEVSIIANDKKE